MTSKYERLRAKINGHGFFTGLDYLHEGLFAASSEILLCQEALDLTLVRVKSVAAFGLG